MKGGDKMEMQSVLKEMTELFVNNTSEALFAKTNSMQKETGDFQSYMNSQKTAKNIEQNVNPEATTKVHTVNGKRQSEMLKKQDTELTKENIESVDGQEALKDITAEDTEVAVEWIQQVKKAICEVLEISEEELEDLMSQLGISFAGLQQFSNLQDLVLAANGEEDKMLFLTDEFLGKQVQNIVQNILQITDDLQVKDIMSEEAFDAILEKVDTFLEEWNINLDQFQTDVKSYQQNLELQELPDKVEEQQTGFLDGEFEEQLPQEIAVDSSKQENAVNGMKQEKSVNKESEEALKSFEKVIEEQDASVETKETKEEVDIETKVITEGVKQTKGEAVIVENTQKEQTVVVDAVAEEKTLKISDTEQTSPKIQFSVEKQGIAIEETESKKDFNHAQADGENMFQQFMEQLSVNRLSGSESVNEKADAASQLEDVVRQVVEQIKVLVKADTTTMEMQLNPEHLGKVNLTVVSREGRITAQFATETEVARQALEAQIQQLRENLGEQGLKVDEVEVTVSNFDFTKQNQANAEQQKEEQRNQQAKRVHRNLNLNEVAGLDLNEAEELAAKIMESNGNQIDYSA